MLVIFVLQPKVPENKRVDRVTWTAEDAYMSTPSSEMQYQSMEPEYIYT